MKATLLAVTAITTVGLALPALASDYETRTPEGRIVVDSQPRQMSVFDYFFNNPEKYKSVRNDPGEYYEGVRRKP